MPIPRQLRSLLHYLLLAAGTLLLGLALLTGLAYYIAVSDQDRVPALVEEICRKNLGAEATFSHYRFQYLEHFPFLSLALEDVVLRDPCFSDHGRELLRIKEMNAVFRPWKMLRREFELKSVTLDTARGVPAGVHVLITGLEPGDTLAIQPRNALYFDAAGARIA